MPPLTDTQRRMLAEMQRLIDLFDRSNARLDALLSAPEPAPDAVVAATEELARLAEEMHPLTTRLAFLGGNRHLARVVTEAGIDIAALRASIDGEELPNGETHT
jgi:hypothetical protein